MKRIEYKSEIDGNQVIVEYNYYDGGDYGELHMKSINGGLPVGKYFEEAANLIHRIEEKNRGKNKKVQNFDDW